MDEQDARQVVEAMWKALDAGDWEGVATYMHEDYVQEWPQSGERIVGRDNAIAINKNFPGGLPKMNFRRIVSAGSLAVMEVALTYADGSRYPGPEAVDAGRRRSRVGHCLPRYLGGQPRAAEDR
jgi:hypothetical protein